MRAITTYFPPQGVKINFLWRNRQLDYHSLPQEEVLSSLGTNAEEGLTSAQVTELRTKFGANKLAEKKKKPLIIRFLEQFKDVMIIILLIAACVSFGIICYEVLGTGEGEALEFVEPALIVFIVILNAIMGLVQESKAEKALEALKNMSAPHARVVRDGKEQFIQAADLVPGDIIILEAGDFVPADARLLTSSNLKSEESALTGESVPSEKDARAEVAENAPLGDRDNMVFSGCSVTYGTARAVVTGTGMNTEMGKIANLLAGEKETKTPLQQKLAQLGKYLGIVALAACAIVFIIGACVGLDWLELFMTAVSLAVSAIPEGLPAVVTIVLSIGVTRMVKKNAIIKRLPAVETLGSASVICSDKTGTLTMNKMTVKRLWVYGGEPVSESADLSKEQLDFLERLSLACTARVGTDDDGSEKIYGDPTETAIVALARAKGVAYDHSEETYEKVGEIPFSSSRKMMTVILRRPEGGYLVLTKGAFDRLPIDRSDKNVLYELERVHDLFASEALRVIALASKEVKKLPEKLEDLESGLAFNGFVGIIDPPRPEAKTAIAKAKAAGIRTVMITGDHAATAGAIARELGIIAANEGILTGQELGDLTDEQLSESVDFYSVYARVTPEDKIRIVRAWQSRGEVVAMTGDGVNDAPALKAADVGVAMGKNGTEVAKGAAKMILLDDKFSTIFEAVTEGRNIFSNIRKLVYFLLVCNISEIFVMLFAQFMGWALPLTPLMLLLINVLGDGIPGMALSKEQSDSRIMKRKPIARTESFFGGGLMEVIIRQTFVLSVVALAAFYLGTYAQLGNEAPSLAAGRTMAFLVTGWTSVLHVLTVRSRKSLVLYRFSENPQLYVSVIVMLALLGGFVGFAAIPSVGAALGMSALGGWHWLAVIVLTLFPTAVAEYGKLWDAVRSRSAEKTAVR